MGSNCANERQDAEQNRRIMIAPTGDAMKRRVGNQGELKIDARMEKCHVDVNAKATQFRGEPCELPLRTSAGEGWHQMQDDQTIFFPCACSAHERFTTRLKATDALPA